MFCELRKVSTDTAVPVPTAALLGGVMQGSGRVVESVPVQV